MRAIVLTVTTCLLLAAALFAQGPGPNPDRIREMLLQMDANKDGVIEKDEVAEPQRTLFSQMLNFADANNDGKIDRDEAQVILERAKNQKAKGKAAAKQTAALLKQMDKDNDGKVSRDEFTSHADYFDRLDTNKDGFIVASEIGPGMGNLLNKNLPFVSAPRSSTGLVPLTDLKTGDYKGKEGGLYPGGNNERPPAHEQAGLAQARLIRPLDAEGHPADDGKIVLLSIGMSNTTQEFSTFMQLADSEPGKNPKLVIVDGAQGGMTARVVSNPDSPPGTQYWATIAARLNQAGVTRAQVQVAWMKEADAMPTATRFPDYATTLENEQLKIAQILKERFPNTRLFYLSSRIYAGYATTPLNPEPFAYEGGFSVKWLIEKQIAGDPELNFDPARGPVKAPWLAWGPYLWADGTKGRGDGLTYNQSDFGGDGTHPAIPGRQKVARQLLTFFKTDSTARIWFLDQR